jgi:hypothetical protein
MQLHIPKASSTGSLDKTGLAGTVTIGTTETFVGTDGASSENGNTAHDVTPLKPAAKFKRLVTKEELDDFDEFLQSRAAGDWFEPSLPSSDCVSVKKYWGSLGGFAVLVFVTFLGVGVIDAVGAERQQKAEDLVHTEIKEGIRISREVFGDPLEVPDDRATKELVDLRTYLDEIILQRPKAQKPDLLIRMVLTG